MASAGQGVARHELADERHDHFVCRICGMIRDVPLTTHVEGIALDMGGGRVQDTHVVYRGSYADCPARAATQSYAFA